MYSIKQILLSCMICAPLCGSAISDEAMQSQMLTNLDTIKNFFELNYAPAEWKKEHLSWDLQKEVQKAKEMVLATKGMTTRGYQKVVSKLFNSTRDYHVLITFHSTESASLPFSIIGIKGKYFISHIEQDKCSNVFHLSEGDEIVLFDQKPIEEVVKQIQMERFGTTEEGTDSAMAEMLLTNRAGAMGFDVPNGPVNIQIRSPVDGALRSIQLIWTHEPEKITCHAELDKPKKTDLQLKTHPFFNKQLKAPYVNFLQAASNASKYALDSKKSFVPALGLKWWETSPDCPYHAYLYETPDHRRIGYLRIPHYTLWSTDELSSILSFFDQMTDALVIDQINNAGGDLWELYATASMLTDQALYTPRHQVAISYDDIEFIHFAIPILESIETDEEAVDLLGDSFGGNPVGYQFAQFFLNYCRFILKEWNAGKTFSSPTHLMGIDQINPHPAVQYSKPILLLINHLDFSGGDFFAAIMQDNKRATLLGTKTAGAGGYVSFFSFPNRFGINYFRLTNSIAYRLSQKPLENLGVTPDIFYEITEEDFQCGYRGYVEAIHKAVDSLTHKVEIQIDEIGPVDKKAVLNNQLG